MAYTAPPKDTVIIVGGLGTRAGAADINGGGATKAAWDAGSPSDFMDANGGPITATTNGAFDYGDKTITAVGLGVGVTVGTLCRCNDGADEASFFDGWYEVTTVADNVLTFANISLSGIDTDQAVDVDCVVGGTIDILRSALDLGVNNGALYSRYIYNNVSEEETAVSVQADVYGGSASTKVYVIGYNATLTAEASITLTCTADITGEVAVVDRSLFSVVTVDYLEFRNINFNAGGKDASKAMYAFYAAASGDGQYNSFYNCNFYGAELDGVNVRSEYVSFVNCGMYLNGQYGFNSLAASAYYQKFICCTIHDNDNHGMYVEPVTCVFVGNLIYDNGKGETGSGIYFQDNGVNSIFINNTIYGNWDSGIYYRSDQYGDTFINNAFIGNGDSGIDMNGGTASQFLYFGYNLAGANTTDAISDGYDFATFCNGNNVDSAQTADQLLKTITDGSEDFTPETSSDLIDAGLDGVYGELDIGAVQSAGGGGGLLTHPGMSGGMRG